MSGVMHSVTAPQRSGESGPRSAVSRALSRGLRLKGKRRCTWCRELGHQRKNCPQNPPSDPKLEERNKRQRADYAAMTPQQKRERRDYNRECIFGLPPGTIAALRAAQGDCCGVCATPMVKGVGWDREHVDHDHETGRVRGLLCGKCNTTIGQIEAALKHPLLPRMLSWIRGAK